MTGKPSENAGPRSLITGGTFNAPVIQSGDDTRSQANLITGGTFNAPVIQQATRADEGTS